MYCLFRRKPLTLTVRTDAVGGNCGPCQKCIVLTVHCIFPNGMHRFLVTDLLPSHFRTAKAKVFLQSTVVGTNMCVFVRTVRSKRQGDQRGWVWQQMRKQKLPIQTLFPCGSVFLLFVSFPVSMLFLVHILCFFVFVLPTS
jgi:hypothetical protein